METAIGKMLLYLMITALFLAAGLSCTKKQGDEEEKGSIEALTEQVGREAADEIKKPIEKARTVDALSRERVQEMDAVEDSGWQ